MTVTPSCFTTQADFNGDPLTSVCAAVRKRRRRRKRKRRRASEEKEEEAVIVEQAPVVITGDGQMMDYSQIRATKVGAQTNLFKN